MEEEQTTTLFQFHQHFTRSFFVQIFQQRQNVTRKKTFVQKTRVFNVDEIDSWCHTNF